MSQINETQTIDINYPVPGKDNNSEGFRSNFAAIEAKFTRADAEITALETTTVRLADANNDPADNDLNQSKFKNGVYEQFNPVLSSAAVPDNISHTSTVSLNNGPVQKFSVSTNDAVTILFTDWMDLPDILTYGVYSSVRLLITSVGSTATVNVPSTGCIVHTPTGWTGGTGPAHFSLVAGKVTVLDAWTPDNGANVYISIAGTW
jgi:hypothetical protein